MEHPGRVARRPAEHSFHVLENQILVGILVIVLGLIAVFGRWRIVCFGIHFHLLHVSALIHSFDATYPAVAGANVNRAERPVAPIAERYNPDGIAAIVGPQRVTREGEGDV